MRSLIMLGFVDDAIDFVHRNKRGPPDLAAYYLASVLPALRGGNEAVKIAARFREQPTFLASIGEALAQAGDRESFKAFLPQTLPWPQLADQTIANLELLYKLPG